MNRRVVFVFVDGWGWGAADASVNPLANGLFPGLRDLLDHHAVPIDATLGLDGMPQSATGQTALLTGLNAARHMGRHAEGFPGAELKVLIREHNLFRQLAAEGLRSTFANAYFVDDVERVRQARFQSVTTVATLSAFGRVRDRAMLEKDEAVYQDLTRESLRERGYDGRRTEPEECAEHLAGISRTQALTLFEYFQTDRAGHSGSVGLIRGVLGLLDRFLGQLTRCAARDGFTLVVTSDHGNIEDMTTPLHTRNPVPFIAYGPGEESLRQRVQSILDVSPAIRSFLTEGPVSP
jgi:hypothetical protein